MDLSRFREVIPDHSNQERWKDIVLNTGGLQSTLQDIKVVERANGYCYKYYSGKTDRNRFIYWRTHHDQLELSEISLDVTLSDNHVRYKFNESAVLAVTIVEQIDLVIILVATVNSVHRLYFPHPEKMHQRFDGSGIDYRSISIFKEASVATAKDPTTFFVIGQNASANNPFHTASCRMSQSSHEAYFALACSSKFMLYTMNCHDGHTTGQELRQSHIVPRILTSFAGSLRGKNSQDATFVNSVVFKQIDNQLYVYALYRDDQIRMWSAKRGTCVTTISTLHDYGEHRLQGSQSNILCDGPGNSVCAFLCFASGSEFKTFDTYDEGNGNYAMTVTATIPAPQYDLIDFRMASNRIWALWCNSYGEFDVSSICMNGGGFNWISVGLEVAPDQTNINSETDPRQEYCSYIFGPGRFQKSTIVKALTMFRRSNVPADVNEPMHRLRERVCQAVEAMLQNEIRDLDISDEEYIEINLQLWERFYSCCDQYHLKAIQPIGLVSLEPLGGLCVVKKSMYSLVRPCELLEHLMLAGDPIDEMAPPQFGYANPKMGANLVKLIAVLRKIDSILPSGAKVEIYNKLMELQMPNNIVSQLVRRFLSEEIADQPFTREILGEIREKLLTIADVPHTMMVLLEALRLDKLDGMADGDVDGGDDNRMDYESGVDSEKQMFKADNSFCSVTGKSFVAESLKQITGIRYALCRNLLILQHLLLETVTMSTDVHERIRSDCTTDAGIFVQSYFVMKWICETPINMRQLWASKRGDSMSQLLSGLHLLDKFSRVRNAAEPDNQYTILEYFLHGRVSIRSLTDLVNPQGDGRSQKAHRAEVLVDESPNWSHSLLELIMRVGQLIWPVAGPFVFGEWLLGTGQYLMVEEYVRLLNGWCEWNRYSRDFIAAITMLNNGELAKAFDYFVSATNGVCTDDFLREKIEAGLSSNASPHCKPIMIAQYYLKVIQMFEQKPALDCVIALSRKAIETIGVIGDEGDGLMSRRAMFQSIAFMNQLKLKHYEEAYDSLINNVEIQRRKEGLRQLVVSLFQKRRLDLLMHFPYVGLQREFEAIVEMRARSMGVEDNVHYKFLYAYHISKENIRKAAFCMYEQAMRLQLECDTLAAVEARYESLLGCINALHLVDDRYQFIAKPVVAADLATITTNRTSAEIAAGPEKLKVEVLEIADIKRELVLTEATLTLHRFRNPRDRHIEGGGGRSGAMPDKIMRLDAQEMVAVLSAAHLYTMALRLTQAYKMSAVPIIKSLTATCIEMTEEPTALHDSWNWLQENNIVDLPPSNSAVDTAWNLLKRIVQENETNVDPTETTLRRACVEELLGSTTAFVPRWLHEEMRSANPNQFLYVMVKHGRLVEASEFAVELIWAMLGRGFEYFGLQNPLVPNGVPLCFPVNTIELLLYNLHVNVTENADKMLPADLEQLQECERDVKEICRYYREKLVQVSQDMVSYKRQKAIPIKY